VALTERHDLRTGTTSWSESLWDIPAAYPFPGFSCDVAIIGSGIMGSILAERLSADGHSVVLLDRRPPGTGSTAASTAELMWAMDVPLCKLAGMLGETEAARRWKRVYRAVRALAERIDTQGLDADRVERPTIYLAGKELDAAGLRAEAVLHAKYDLPSIFLDGDAVNARFGIRSVPALVSDGGFEVDPVKLTHAMLRKARERGARLCYPQNVASLSEEKGGVRLALESGQELLARQVILASGYERATLFLPPEFSLLTTFVMATAPGVAPLWKENAMIWEASDPYLYIRTNADGRVIAGGEDEDITDPSHRDALLRQKAGTIAVKTAALLGCDTLQIDRVWAATFGSSPDGLPAIGRAANMANVWLAAGFGGNGIAFAALASDLLSAAFKGTPDPDSGCFDPYRFGR
jgi:glycine/D-amino acid oxidase-like deaminating enzyme